MQIWTGLGNPGPQYAMHRHNIGFMACDVLAEMHGFGPAQKKFSGWVQEGRIGSAKGLLLKPASFMNESGRAVGEALRFYKLDTDALTVSETVRNYVEEVSASLPPHHYRLRHFHFYSSCTSASSSWSPSP